MGRNFTIIYYMGTIKFEMEENLVEDTPFYQKGTSSSEAPHLPVSQPLFDMNSVTLGLPLPTGIGAFGYSVNSVLSLSAEVLSVHVSTSLLLIPYLSLLSPAISPLIPFIDAL